MDLIERAKAQGWYHTLELPGLTTSGQHNRFVTRSNEGWKIRHVVNHARTAGATGRPARA